MTQEEKQILLADLCARLPYHVLGLDCFGKLREMQVIYPSGTIIAKEIDGENCSSCKFVPYLRSLSSMTVEEEYEYHQCKNIDYLKICEMEHAEMLETVALGFSRAIDWLNKKMFDYRGLIPMGLALPAKEGMYNTKTE